MSLAAFHWLLSDAGQRRLDQLADTPITPQTHLQLATRLRQELSPDQISLLLDTLMLREQAKAKFAHAERMYFTPTALQMATAEIVAQHRSDRYAKAGLRRVADLGCSIGSDALALTHHADVVGIDRDPLRLAMARENVRTVGGPHAFAPVEANLLTLPPLAVDGLFFDPARRDKRGKRIYSVHAYQPPLSLLDAWLPTVPHAGAKISPGVDYAELPPSAELEIISLAGDVKEAVVWFGDLHSGVARRATLLPSGDTLTNEDGPDSAEVAAPRAFLYEPDGAVIRAHLVSQLAAQLGGTLIDEEIAYISAEELQPTPFARAYAIDDAFPFQLKRLRRYLRDRNMGPITIKKRGSPLDPEALRKQLRLRGTETCVIFLTQVMGAPTVLVGQPVES